MSSSPQNNNNKNPAKSFFLLPTAHIKEYLPLHSGVLQCQGRNNKHRLEPPALLSVSKIQNTTVTKTLEHSYTYEYLLI